MKNITKQILSLLIFTGLSTPLFAGEKENDIINKTVQAYGGDSFLTLKGLAIEDKYKGFRFGQSNSPLEPDIAHNYYRINLDFANQRKEFKWIRGEGDDFSLQHQLFDGIQGHRINHNSQTMYEQSSITYSSAERRHLLLLDTAIVQYLNQSRETAEFLEAVQHQGALHNKVSFKHSSLPKMTVYINAKTGLISTMTRPHWKDGLFRSHYSKVKTIDKVKFAHNTYVTRGGKPFQVLTERKIMVNPSFENEFALPKNYGEEGESLNFDEMSLKKLSQNVYLVGKGWGFSIFYDAGDYYVASGGYKDLTARFDKVKAFTGKNNPLKYQVVTHHHLDHLDGMNEADKLGVTFVAAKDHIETIKSMVDKPLADDRFLLINSSASIANDMVTAVDVPSAHASQHVTVYFKEAKTLFTADTYFSRQETGAPNGHDGLVRIKSTLAKENITPDFFAAAHSGRVLTKVDFNESLQKRAGPSVCPVDWGICKNR